MGKDAMPSFLQERARICLQCMLLPRWRRRWRRLERPWTCCAILAGIALPIWALLLNTSDIHPLVPSFLLFLAVLLCDLFLAQRPWRGPASHDHHLWWCARSDPPVNKRKSVTF